MILAHEVETGPSLRLADQSRQSAELQVQRETLSQKTELKQIKITPNNKIHSKLGVVGGSHLQSQHLGEEEAN